MRRLALIVFIGVIGVVFVTAWRSEHRRHPSDGCPVETTVLTSGGLEGRCFLLGP